MLALLAGFFLGTLVNDPIPGDPIGYTVPARLEDIDGAISLVWQSAEVDETPDPSEIHVVRLVAMAATFELAKLLRRVHDKRVRLLLEVKP